MNDNKYKHLLYSDEVVTLAKPPRKRTAPEKPSNKPKDCPEKSFTEEVTKVNINRKTKIQPKHFVFPETATPRSCNEINEVPHCGTPQFTPVAIQEQRSPSCFARRSQLTLNMEALPSPTFGMGQSFLSSPVVDCECGDRRDVAMPSPINAWIVSPLAFHLHGFPNVLGLGCGLRADEEREGNVCTEYSQA